MANFYDDADVEVFQQRQLGNVNALEELRRKLTESRVESTRFMSKGISEESIKQVKTSNKKYNMKKDLIFLGENGLTSTSANHLANMAKEFVQKLQYTLDNINFVDSKVTIIGSNNYNVLSEGINQIKLGTIKEHLNSIAEANSLIAWLREGIKAKENILKEIKNTNLNEYCKANNIEMPECPTQEDTLTEDEYLSTLSIKERNRYFELQTICAVYGKFVHPDGAYNNARKKLNDAIQHPHGINGSGRDALLYTYTPSVSIETVDEKFFDMQSYHRACQAELNGIKHKMDEAITLDAQTKGAKYAEEYDNYSNAKAALNAKLSAWKVNETKRVQELKIVIPNSLNDIYNVINALGKA